MTDRLSRIVLVHGAAHGAWCWEKVVPLLEAKGFEVATLDLPGLGDDPTPPKDVTLQAYFDRVIEVLNAGPGPALLVGHSMGGMPISGAAEAVPEKVGKLVYLAALLPEDGLRMGDFDLGPDSALRARAPSEVEGTFGFDPALAAEVFYNTCTAEDAAAGVARLRPQATGPFPDPVTLTPQRWGAIPKTYILCTRDQAFPLAKQEWLCDRTPGVRRRSLATDHSPFLSDPQGLADILADEARL